MREGGREAGREGGREGKKKHTIICRDKINNNKI